MIWARVSSWSCFCWLYRASPSLAAKNIINLISVLTIWWCPCVDSSLVLLEEGVLLWPVHFLGKTLLVFALLHSTFQGKICLLLQVFLDFLLLHSSPRSLYFPTRILNVYRHRTGKGQFSFQFQRKAMPKNAQTTTQLHSSHMLVK